MAQLKELFMSFSEKLHSLKLMPLKAKEIEILQMNITQKCNLSCKHCHLECGPNRDEMMEREILEKCLDIAQKTPSITTIDITGGAPEMNPHLSWFLEHASQFNKRLIVRSNLVILLKDEYQSLINDFAKYGVEVVGSLPDYHADRTDRQRGQGNFEETIEAIRRLNVQGYGQSGSGLILDLVHNPVGTFLPGSQQALEHEYKTQLKKSYNIGFNNLFSLANMPIGRYLAYLKRTNNYEDYMIDLVKNFNTSNIGSIMCKTTLSVASDGKLNDCDFNQALGLSLSTQDAQHVEQFDYDKLRQRLITLGDHCYGCTAGSGSSCQGCFE